MRSEKEKKTPDPVLTPVSTTTNQTETEMAREIGEQPQKGVEFVTEPPEREVKIAMPSGDQKEGKKVQDEKTILSPSNSTASSES